jgi:hypothetical protein
LSPLLNSLRKSQWYRKVETQSKEESASQKISKKELMEIETIQLDRIKRLEDEMVRKKADLSEELACLRQMISCERRVHLYGQYDKFSHERTEEHKKRMKQIQDELEDLKTGWIDF